MLDFAELINSDLAEFQKLARQQTEKAMPGSQLELMRGEIYLALQRPGNLLARQAGEKKRLWRWSWLVPLVYQSLNSSLSPDELVASLAASVECLQVSTASPGHNLQQALVGLGQSLLLGPIALEGEPTLTLALLKCYNRGVNQLITAQYEEIEQNLAEQTGQDIYTISIGRKQATLASVAVWFGALAALGPLASPRQLVGFGQFGYSLGVLAQLVAELEFYTVGSQICDRPLVKNLPLIYAQTQIDDGSRLEICWQNRDWSALQKLVRETKALMFVAELAENWAAKCKTTLDQQFSFPTNSLYSVLAVYQQRLSAIRLNPDYSKQN